MNQTIIATPEMPITIETLGGQIIATLNECVDWDTSVKIAEALEVLLGQALVIRILSA